MTETTLRLFVAINLPPELRRELHDATATLRDAAPGRWVARDNLHLTVKFLGQCKAVEVDPLAEALTRAAARFDPVRLTIGGLGAFPNLRAPRVVWIGVDRDPKLELLQHEVETACTALGYQMEGRPFRPHITLGRPRDAGREQARALADAARRIEFTRTIEAATLDLMRSELGPGGSRYAVLAALPLAGQ